MTNETKCMSKYFLLRVHQLLTSSLNKNDSKYRIFQIKEDNSLSKKSDLNNKYIEIDYETDQGKTYVKESRLS